MPSVATLSVGPSVRPYPRLTTEEGKAKRRADGRNIAKDEERSQWRTDGRMHFRAGVAAVSYF